jgi:hypothetical protein
VPLGLGPTNHILFLESLALVVGEIVTKLAVSELLREFLQVCRDFKVVQIATALLQESNAPMPCDLQAGLDFHATA